ncbi:MAG: hypothetical protein ACTHK7_14975 [Aureliella sp.]
MILAQLRPEFLEAVHAAWWNWRFGIGLILPPVVFYAMTKLKCQPFLALPIAAAAFWLAFSLGIEHVSDAMADNAVTREEMCVAAADTGRTFAPFLVFPVWALLYSGLWLGLVRLRRKLSRATEQSPETQCPNCGRTVAVATIKCPRCMNYLCVEGAGASTLVTMPDSPYAPPSASP